MFRPSEPTAIGLLVCALAMASGSRAQEESTPPPPPAITPDEIVEQYLSDRGLTGPLAASLRERLAKAPASERSSLADRLGRLYARQLDEATTPEEREEVRSLAKRLLEQVPEADSFDLRINLAKGHYLFAEEVAERHRVRLATAEERLEAERTLRDVKVAFEQVALRANARVEQLERLEEARDVEVEVVRAALGDARRLRSLASYYAGWSSYYLSVLTGSESLAGEALRHLGWLLNSPGNKIPTLDRVPKELLRYEHVARAALCAGLCESARGNGDTAIRWLDQVESAPDVPESVKSQVFARRLAVLTAANRWADVEYQVQRRRKALPAEQGGFLPVGEARLLAVLSLEALTSSPDRFRPIAERLAKGAMTDLIGLSEVSQVLNLVTQYGSAPIGAEGFIVHYVRGLQAYERARALHQASGDPEAPTADPQVITEYRAVAALLDTAAATRDAAGFTKERTNAGLVAGLALYFAGDHAEAATRLTRAHAQAATADQAEEALWLAVVALDQGVAGGAGELSLERDRVSALYLQSYPSGERAAKLLLRQSGGAGITDLQAAEILLAIDPASPLRDAALRQAARLLYRAYRASRGDDMDFAAMRFVGVAEQVLAGERRAVAQGKGQAASNAGANAVAIARQMLDALLSVSSPDPARAEAVLDAIQAVASQAGIDLTAHEAELTYRKLQVCVARGDEIGIGLLSDRLGQLGGPFAASAERLLLQRARARLAQSPKDVSAARGVVTHGARVMSALDEQGQRVAEPSVAALHNAVADAAALVWREAQDETMRDVAIRIDRRLIDEGQRSADVLRRFAELSEAAGASADALEAWRTLLAAMPVDTPAWFEARFHSVRLLAVSDRPRAVEAMNQHVALHPELGPAPWGERLRGLAKELGVPVPDQAPPAPQPPTKKGGG